MKECACSYEVGFAEDLKTIAERLDPCALHHEYAVQQIQKSARIADPVPMRLICPDCGALHIDKGEFQTKPHHTHACQWCGMVWRPAVVATVGVQFLPGYKNEGAGK